MFKVVLVDDEQMEKILIEKLILQLSLDTEVVSFNNGFDAIEYISSNDVDILITDIRMPRMSGLELVKKIRLTEKKIKIIILSGFAEFEYVREAMKYGVKRYLLKPVEANELREALSEAKKESEEERNIEYNDNFENCIEFLENLCIGAYEDKENIKSDFVSSGFPFDFEHSRGMVINVKIEDIHDGNDEEYEKSLLNIFSDRFKRSVFNIHSKENVFMYFLFTDDKINLDEIEKEINELTNHIVKIELVTSFDNIAGVDISSIFSVEERLKLFISRIISNDTVVNKRIAEKVINDCSGYEFNFDSIKNNVVYGLINEENIKLIQEFNKRVKFEIRRSGNDAMDVIEDFIVKNYSRDITREQVAAVVNMNPSYFSRYFMKRKNISFHDYLIDYRIEKAKELLLTDRSIESITADVGFLNTKTFRRNFVSRVKMSPLDYRRKYGGK